MFGSDIIRVRIKGFVKNITEKENTFFDEKGIYNKNKITFISDNIKYTIKYSDSEIVLTREGNDFINSFVFHKKKGKGTYTLKDNNYAVEMDIIVHNMDISNKVIYVKYTISDTGSLHECKIEMSECL